MMFEHFILGTQATHHQQQDELADASPTDVSCLPQQPAPTSYPFPDQCASPVMNDILSKLDCQRLVPDETEHSQTSMLSDPSSILAEDGNGEDCEFTFVSTRHGLATLRSTAASPSLSPTPSWRRIQRQINTQLQTCTNHVKDINTLVSDMISTSSQCTVHAAPSTPLPTPTITPLPPPSIPAIMAIDPLHPHSTPTLEADIDEGFSELDDIEALELLLRQQEQEEEEFAATASFRSAGAPSGVRKFTAMRHPFTMVAQNYRGREGGPNHSTRDTGKVRCVPRMRRRKDQGQERRPKP